VLHAGSAENPALADYLALGASEIKVIAADEIIENLAKNVKDADLILTGSRAESGQNSGLLPYLLAAKLNMPIVTNVLEIKPIGDQLEILQFLPKGKRRRITLNLPAVVAIHPLAAIELQYAYARQQQGKIIATNDTVAKGQLHSKTQPAARKPNKLRAYENLTGHERLLAAISSESKGGAVVNEGNCVEKAQVILDYLRQHQLISF
jgi:electron transfer flavoprotein beta subunit